MDVCQQCRQHQGRWISFQTPWGLHRGIVERVVDGAVLVRVPMQYAPAGLASLPKSEEQKLDIALAQWAAGSYGAAPGYGINRRPGYGWWGGGWLFWWLAFASIMALAFLW